MFVFDTHLHTNYYSSCSVITPEELIQQAIQVRLDGIAITEHGIRWPNEKLDGLRRLADPHGLILINGQEVHTSTPPEWHGRRISGWRKNSSGKFGPGESRQKRGKTCSISARLIPDLQPSLDNHDGLIIRDFEAAPTTWVWAGQDIVYPHQIVTRLGELRAVVIAGPGRDILLLRAPQPPNLELS